jgi:transketolase
MRYLLREKKFEQNVYGNILEKAGELNKNVLVVDADLARATQTDLFSKKFPDRYFDIGIAEQDMLGIAAGMAVMGKIPFVGTFATFVTKRACDQINVSIAYPRLDVRIIGIEAGLSSGRNGATHQSVDDLAIMRAMPNMTVVVPADAEEIKQVVIASLEYKGPVYFRMQRGSIPTLFDREKYRFDFGKGVKISGGNDVTIISTGIMTKTAIEASDELKKQGISAGIVHMPTLKPLDKDILIEAAIESKALVTVENHSIIGGLGSSVAETIVEGYPVPMERVGIKDTFGETGDNDYLFNKYGLSVSAIIKAAQNVIKRK